MANEVRLSKFPSNEYEALALLYIQQQDLSNLSPEEIYDKYKETEDKIRKHAHKNVVRASLIKFTVGFNKL